MKVICSTLRISTDIGGEPDIIYQCYGVLRGCLCLQVPFLVRNIVVPKIPTATPETFLPLFNDIIV